jgi:hypothetical protein
MPFAPPDVRTQHGLPPHPLPTPPDHARKMPDSAIGKAFVWLFVAAWVIFMVWLISGMVASR